MSYPARVAANILPLSRAQSLPAAFTEWHFTGYTCDHGEAEETCHMCEQEHLRYHFEIENRVTGSKLMVGSKCILRFDLEVVAQGRRLNPDEAKKHLNDHMRRMRFESCLSALREVAAADDRDYLRGALTYFQKHGKLSPRLAAIVFGSLQRNRIDHDPSFFGVSLKRHQHQDDLRSMPTDRVHLFWKALTPAQREMAMDLGHTEPTKRDAATDAALEDLKRRVEAARKNRI